MNSDYLVLKSVNSEVKQKYTFQQHQQQLESFTKQQQKQQQKALGISLNLGRT